MTTATSQLQQQLHDELLPLYGRPLADSAVLDFLARHGFKCPKPYTSPRVQQAATG